MLSQIRYEQQLAQTRAAVKPVIGSLATYLARDPITGQRIVLSADGSESSALYLSNSEPIGVLPLSQSSTIGLIGYISQKPA